MIPPTYAAKAYQAASIMEGIIRTWPELLKAEDPHTVLDYPGAEPLRRLDLSLAQAQWAFFEAKRRVREEQPW